MDWRSLENNQCPSCGRELKDQDNIFICENILCPFIINKDEAANIEEMTLLEDEEFMIEE